MGVSWKKDPDEHDYPAAQEYLSLLLPPAKAARMAELLRTGRNEWHPAKDLLRAAQLPLLPEDNGHVAADLRKIRNKQPLSPILLMRGSLTRRSPLQIIDGYHRISAVYHFDEDALVSCRVIDYDW